MSRVITSSEIDTLHKQVAELQRRQNDVEAFLKSAFDRTTVAPAELFEVLGQEAAGTQDVRSPAADSIVDVLASESPSAI